MIQRERAMLSVRGHVAGPCLYAPVGDERASAACEDHTDRNERRRADPDHRVPSRNRPTTSSAGASSDPRADADPWASPSNEDKSSTSNAAWVGYGAGEVGTSRAPDLGSTRISQSSRLYRVMTRSSLEISRHKSNGAGASPPHFHVFTPSSPFAPSWGNRTPRFPSLSRHRITSMRCRHCEECPAAPTRPLGCLSSAR